MKSDINQENPLEFLKLQYIHICMNVQILTVNSMHFILEQGLIKIFHKGFSFFNSNFFIIQIKN